MAVKSSGTLGLVSDIVAEFGGTSTYALTDYYRGGGLVPDVSANSSVPTSGTIAITDFYGSVALVISLSTLDGDTVSRNGFTTSGTSVSTIAGVRLETDGGMQTSEGTGTGADWQDYASGEYANTEPDAGLGSDYEARLTVLSGDTPTASPGTGVWVGLGTERDWTLGVTGENVSKSGSWKLEIRDAATSTLQASATFTISAQVATI